MRSAPPNAYSLWYLSCRGRPDTEEGSYGPARLVDAERVRTFAKAFDDAESLIREGFDAQALTTAVVYPDIWEHEDAKPFLLDHAARLADFYREAADRGYAIITWTG